MWRALHLLLIRAHKQTCLLWSPTSSRTDDASQWFAAEHIRSHSRIAVPCDQRVAAIQTLSVAAYSDNNKFNNLRKNRRGISHGMLRFSHSVWCCCCCCLVAVDRPNDLLHVCRMCADHMCSLAESGWRNGIIRCANHANRPNTVGSVRNNNNNGKRIQRCMVRSFVVNRSPLSF